MEQTKHAPYKCPTCDTCTKNNLSCEATLDKEDIRQRMINQIDCRLKEAKEIHERINIFKQRMGIAIDNPT